MVGEFQKQSDQTGEGKGEDERFRKKGLEIVAEGQRLENKETLIEERVKSAAIKELKASLKGKNKRILNNCSGDITGVVDQLEKGEKISSDLFKGASEGSEEKMTAGLLNLVTSTFDILKPLDNIGALFNALGASMDDEIDANIEAYYEKYCQTEEGKKRLKEIRSQVESEYENK